MEHLLLVILKGFHHLNDCKLKRGTFIFLFCFSLRAVNNLVGFLIGRDAGTIFLCVNVMMVYRSSPSYIIYVTTPVNCYNSVRDLFYYSEDRSSSVQKGTVQINILYPI